MTHLITYSKKQIYSIRWDQEKYVNNGKNEIKYGKLSFKIITVIVSIIPEVLQDGFNGDIPLYC